MRDSETTESPGSVRRIVRNSLFNTVVNGVSAISYMVLFIALARGLQPAAMGAYYTLFALILVIQTALEMGVPTVMTGRIAQAPSRLKALVSEAAPIQTISIAAQLLIFVGMGLAATALSADRGTILRFFLAGCAAAAIQLQRYCFCIFRAFEVFVYENVMRLCQGAGLAVTVVTLIVAGFTELNLMVAVLAASHVFGALYMLINVQRRYRCLGWRWDPTRIRDWLTESIPLGVGESIRGQGWQLDTVLLGLLQPAAVVGIYSAAYRPLTMFYWLPVASTAAIFPTFVRLAPTLSQFNRAVAGSIRMLWIGALPVAVVISLGAEHLITLLAGREYLAAGLPMRILVWKVLFASLGIVFRYMFAAIGKLSAFARIVLISTLVDATTELILIPKLGYLGACFGTLLGEFLFMALILMSCRQLGIRCIDWRSLARVLFAAGIMALFLWPARGTSLPVFLLAAAVTGALYLLICLGLGSLSSQEARHFFSALSPSKRAQATNGVEETGGLSETAQAELASE